MRIITLILLAVALNTRGFEVTTFVQEIPEAGSITATRVIDGKTQITFTAPRGWTSSSDAGARRVSLQGTAPKGTINIQFSTNAMPADIGQFRQQATNALQSATVLDTFTVASGVSPGLGLDVRHVINTRFQITSRVAVFKSPDGTIEVTMASSPEEFENLHIYWTWVMNSLKIEPRSGKPPGAR